MKTQHNCIRLLGLSVIIGILLSLNQQVAIYAQKAPLGIREYKGIWIVSLARVLAAPGEVQGKRISVGGVLSSTHESTALYLEEGSFKHGITENSVWLDCSGLTAGEMKAGESAHGRWVRISGTFDGDITGHLGLCSGGMVVSRITPVN